MFFVILNIFQYKDFSSVRESVFKLLRLARPVSFINFISIVHVITSLIFIKMSKIVNRKSNGDQFYSIMNS